MEMPNQQSESLSARVNGLSAVARALIKQQSSPEAQSISTEDGLTAALQIAEVAKQQGVACALAGGIAMHLYGFTRATTDVDLIGAQVLNLLATRELSFGGVTYPTKVGERTINVDWIVRADEIADFYAAALQEAVPSEAGLPIITPEWLVILKKLADRGKDHLDLLWLLRHNDLVDRNKVEALVRQHFGRFAFLLLNDLQALYLEADIMRAKDERDEDSPAAAIKS